MTLIKTPIAPKQNQFGEPPRAAALSVLEFDSTGHSLLSFYLIDQSLSDLMHPHSKILSPSHFLIAIYFAYPSSNQQHGVSATHFLVGSYVVLGL